MYAVTKTYKDFNGVERTETKLFNLTETEVMAMANISRSLKRFPENLPALSSTIFCLWNWLQMMAKRLNS